MHWEALQAAASLRQSLRENLRENLQPKKAKRTRERKNNFLL
jgi:hypothetical protein